MFADLFFLKLGALPDRICSVRYARELGGNDMVIGNYYTNGMLRLCEMSEKKVVDFVLGLEQR